VARKPSAVRTETESGKSDHPKATSKTTPARPTATKKKASKPATSKTAASKPAAPKKSGSTGRTTTRGAGTPGGRPVTPSPSPAEVFYPSPETSGYVPGPSRPVPPTPVRPDPAPYTPPPSYPGGSAPFYRPPEKKNKGKGCALGCFGLAVVLFVLPMASQVFSGSEEDSSDSRNRASPTAPACPDRISEAIPSGEGAVLIEAFRTKNKQITMCRTTGGKLYYYGEFSDQREPGIAMRAAKKPGGYEARNDPYSYRIKDGTVTIYRNGTRIGREELVPEPSPS